MFAARLAAALALTTSCASVQRADAGALDPEDAGLDAGVDAGTPPLKLQTPRIAGWEERLLTWFVTSTVQGIESREVTVLLPLGYGEAANASRRYPVLYMHDGKNCLDHDAFRHGGWQVHTISTTLTAANQMAPVIFVLVDNTTSRTEEYVRDAGAVPGPTADRYLDFLERDVVPWVDATWRTQANAAGRGLGGSSFGALSSLDGAWRRKSWGVVMAMSPAYGYDFVEFARAGGKLPLRIYLDSGTVDYRGGDDSMVRTLELRDLLVSKGWALGADLNHTIGQGHNHDESFWRERLPAALTWLFPP